MSIEQELYSELKERILKYHPTKDFSMLETSYYLADKINRYYFFLSFIVFALLTNFYSLLI